MSAKVMDKCKSFIENNGWNFTFEEDQECYYDKPNCLSIGLCLEDKTITFFNDEGDILTLPANLYSLIGFLFHHRQIACNYSMDGVS